MKPTRCTVCLHPQRAEIEAAHVAGFGVRELAKRFGKSKTTLHAHVRDHIPNAAQKAIEAADAREIDRGDAIISEIRSLGDEARRLQKLAERKRDYRTAISAIRELVRLVELKARILGELRDREISITSVQIDAATAERMATMFLARRNRQIAPTGSQPVVDLQVTANESDKNRCP